MGTELPNGGVLKQDLYVQCEVAFPPYLLTQPMRDRHLGSSLPWIVYVQPFLSFGEGVGGCTWLSRPKIVNPWCFLYILQESYKRSTEMEPWPFFPFPRRRSKLLQMWNKSSAFFWVILKTYMFIRHGLNTFGQNVNLNKLNFKIAFETEICL